MHGSGRSSAGLRNKILIVGLGSALLPGCMAFEHQKELSVRPEAVDTGCVWTRAIRPTDKDWDVMSDSLVQQISAHNELGATRCGWQPNPPGF